MCEVQSPGGPGSAGGASQPPEKLSVSSSEDEEDQKPPRHSLLGHSEEILTKELSLEGTSNSRDEPREDDASKDPLVTQNNREEEEEKQVEKMEDETEKLKVEMLENGDKEEEKEEEEEEKQEESDSEAKDIQVSVCDENEKENQENERRDGLLLENTVKIEREIKEEKIVDGSGEENTRGNDEEASASDHPMEDQPQRQKEEEEEGEKEEEREKKEEAEEGTESKHQQEDEKKPKETETEMEENAKENLKEKETEKKEKKKEEEEEEGVDPFKPKCRDAPTTHRVSKTVNFLESELKTCIDNKRHTINSFSSSSSSSSYMVTSKAKGEEDTKDEDRLEGRVEADEKTTRAWTIGEGNPVYRLSMKLSPNLFNTTDIPGANQHKEAEKAGFLTKLSGRSFPYIAQWKRRYCVLSKGRLYYYEREDSKAGDKSNGVIQLEYFDQVAEAGPKECKKATNVFIITSQDRSFFDPGRHVFSADTLPDMKDWIRKLQAALEQIRNNNRPAASTSPSASPSAKEGGGKRRRDEAAESKDGKGNQNQPTTTTTAKDRRKKKEESSRPRKSSRVGVSSQTQTSMVEPMTCEPDGGRPATAIPKGGVMLPGFSSRKDSQMTKRPAERRTGEGEAEEDLPQAGPTLPCVTKQRVKGPQGRRAPQNRRKAAAALKKRASSLSALEHQDGTDNREAPWMNRSLDLLEGGNPWGRKQVGTAVPSAALPYKAYNYSSDEDDMDDDQSDSFPASASGMPPPPPPRSASYGLELMRSASQGGVAPRERQVPRCSLDDARGSQRDLMGSRDSVGGWRGSHGEAWGGSRGSLGQNGRASPVMDDLDNLLMNQSVQHSSAAMDSVSDAGSEGSSTCRATDHQQPPPALDHCHHHHHHQAQQTQQPRKKPQDLSRFTTAVRHLQRHVVEIDRAVFAVTGDVGSTRREVATLREAVAALQADAHTITTTLSNLTQEAITAQQKISFATQSDASYFPPEKEAEKVQLSVREALREAERAKQEQLKSKREYEELVAEMKVALQLFREASPASVPVPTQYLASDTAPAPVAKSSSNSQGAKGSSGYQSIFSKSSSIISGFTNRHSLSKSVSFIDQKEKRKSEGQEAKASSLDRNKKYDKKDKKDGKESKTNTSTDKKDKHSNTMERKEAKQQQHKQKPVLDADFSDLLRVQDGESERKGFNSFDRRERRGRQEGRDKRDHVISPLFLDDIPMADDAIQEYETKSDLPSAPPSESHAGEASTHKASFKQTLSITLGQSSKSPAGASSRPHVLPLGRERHSGDLSTSNTSPDSPLPPSSFTRPSSYLPTLEESPPVSETTSLSSLHQPGSTPGPQARQGAMSTVQKAAANPQPSKRPGTFAISRQNSSPNIPIQRQNSGSAFPIQRQQSLGTVPEGRLPRQESLTSVPEDRPLADRTLPLSPSPSLTYFPLSPTASSSTLGDSARRPVRNSMELVTGPVLAGSSIQEANATGTLPVLHPDDRNMQPAATSTLKRPQGSHSDNLGILV